MFQRSLRHGVKRGFTLIELLVVIAIIAILAAILFPVFAQAREAARKSACQSNLKQIGTALMMYKQDYDETFPSAYYYLNDSSSANGYAHWSGVVQPYVKNWGIFICPSDKNRGLAPTNFVGNNLGYGVPGGQTSQNAVQDIQAPRLSYTSNSAVMGRKRRTADPANTVSDAAVDNVADTILVAEMTDIIPCINDSSAASGVAYKTHRSMHGVKLAGGGVFSGEAASEYGQPLMALSYVEAINAFNTCATASANGLNHISYIANADRHAGGTNYLYVDGHVKWNKLQNTMNPLAWQWGKKFYSAGSAAVYQPGTSVPVQ